MSTIQERNQNHIISLNLMPHIELVAALFSGVLILIAWLLGNMQQETAQLFFIYLHL